MEKRTSEYWQERFQQLEEAQHDTSVQTMQGIEQEFRRTEQVLDGKINAWYQRFASNNKISMIEARRLLNSDELEEFKWDVQDYIKYGEENGINQQWMKELENASAKVHISRLEALKLQTQQELEKLYGNYHDSIDEHITNLYTSGYYHTAFEVQRGMGVGWQMQNFNSEKVSDIIHKPWAVDGRNFSDRVWMDKTRLINSMHDSLTRMCITGESPDRAIQEISKNMKVSRSQAARIVQTESAAFSAKAQESCFSDLGVEEFQVVETLDSNTCDTCGEMDGKHFQMKDYKIGVTVPPFHPNCRGCTCPYFDDEFDSVGERAARGEDGKTYFVPANMTYREWEKSLQEIKPNTRSMDVNVHSEDNTVKETKVKTPDIKFSTKQGSTITAKQKFEDTVTVTSAYNDLPIKVQRQFSGIKFEFGYAGSACDIKNRTIRVGIGAAKEEIFHEVGHLIENYMLDSDTVREYKEYLVEGLTYSDIIKEIYYNTSGNGSEIFLIKGSRFESEYQSRLYVNIALEAINGDGTINIVFLAETISEAFRKYMNGEELSDKVKKIIEDVVL